jgi:hypothetical protein
MLADRMLPEFGVELPRPTRLVYPPDLSVRKPKLEYEYTLTTNSRGIRDEELPLKNRSQEHRIAFLGDIQTAGIGVPIEQTFVSRIDKLLKRAHTVNCGKDWANTLTQARIYYHVALSYHPDLVVLCVSADALADMPTWNIEKPFELPPPDVDWTDWLWPNLSAARRASEQQNAYRTDRAPFAFLRNVLRHARRKRLHHSRIAEWRRSVARHPRLVHAAAGHRFTGNVLSLGILWDERWAEALDLGQGRSEKAWDNFRAVVAAMIRDTRQRRLRFAVVFIPDRIQYEPTHHAFLAGLGYRVIRRWLTEDSRFQRALCEWCGDRDVPFLDLTDAFRTHPRPGSLSRRYGAELTPEGHAVAASELAAWLPRVLRRRPASLRHPTTTTQSGTAGRPPLTTAPPQTTLPAQTTQPPLGLF